MLCHMLQNIGVAEMSKNRCFRNCQNKCYIATLSNDTIVLGKSTCVEMLSTQVEKHIETLKWSQTNE